MNKYLIIFLIASALAVGSIIVWSRNNANSKKEPTTSQNLFNFNSAQANPSVSPTMSQPQVTQLIIEDIKEGTGSAVKNGDTVEVHYVGTLLNGQKFDSSIDRNEPFSFTLGTGQVISGWDQGLIGMKVGGKRKLTIPPDLAYGNQAVGPIPPNSPLIFEIDLLSIK